MDSYHVPVLLHPSIDLLEVTRASCIYVDLTFGGGGHSCEILHRMGPEGRLYGFDQDADVFQNIPNDPRFHFVYNNFRFMRGCLRTEGIEQVDGILADLGVSSHHFDAEERGFSFRFDAPLDMRMNTQSSWSAKELLNTYEVEQLTRIFREYGELSNAYKLALRIVQVRCNQPLERISDLVECVKSLTPRGEENKFLAKLFQAIRIEVNGELEALKMMLEQALCMLKPGGRLVVLTYHSLEDRLVKNFMKSGNFEGKIERDFYGHAHVPFDLITGKPQVPDEAELLENSRSRSAKLRAAAKI